MPKRPIPDEPGPAGSATGGSSADPGTLTSDDIFGEILDEVGGQRLGDQGAAPSPDGRGPIKVQVSEPPRGGEAHPPARKAVPPRPTVKELLPEDVAALLDVFSAPAEAAAAAATDADPETVPELAAAAQPAEPAPVPDPDLVMDELEPFTLEPEGDDALPPPPPSLRSAEAGGDEGLRDLMNLMRMPKARAHKMESGPNKFTVAEATPPGAAPALDLAALAEQALDEGAVVPGPPAPEPLPVAAPPAEIEFGPYRLLHRIAAGGMAEVFRAKRAGVEGFEKVVAVKRILPHLSDNKEFVEMFIDEAKVVAGLTHPGIVQIFDLGRIDKTYFIAMEYVHGRDLRSILRRARERGMRLPLDLAVLIASRVSAALEFAHRKKDERGRPMLVVHRDVSPQNILISFEGEVKLTDFGIAKAATKASLTDAGALRGKLLYMSPEQAWGKAMDRRSDVFSLGIVLYEMATDRKPFVGGSEMSVLEMVRECRVAAPSEVNPRIPDRLERVLLKALDRDPDGRYQDAAEMHRDLERVLHERQPPTVSELARFMEILFDEAERSEAAPSAAAGPGAEEEAAAEPEAAPPVEPEPPSAPRAPSRDPMSIQKLLKRFGLK